MESKLKGDTKTFGNLWVLVQAHFAVYNDAHQSLQHTRNTLDCFSIVQWRATEQKRGLQSIN